MENAIWGVLAFANLAVTIATGLAESTSSREADVDGGGDEAGYLAALRWLLLAAWLPAALIVGAVAVAVWVVA